jgi:biopolymer transport protein ExbD
MKRLSRKQRADKARKLLPEEDPEFQIAPMIDILLVLLVFFMTISSTEVLAKNHNINLAVAADGDPASKNSPGQVIVNIEWLPATNTGSIDIADTVYPDANAIVAPIQKALAVNPLARVLIRADRGVKWAYMKTVMKAVSQAGVENVTFSVVNKDQEAQ